MQEVQSVMHECEELMHRVGNDNVVMSSVKGWSLLLSIVPSHVIPSLVSRYVHVGIISMVCWTMVDILWTTFSPNLFYICCLFLSELPLLTNLLEKSADLNVKVATGQAIALILEIAREADDDVSTIVSIVTNYLL